MDILAKYVWYQREKRSQRHFNYQGLSYSA